MTQARLKELLLYDPDTGIFTRRVSSGGKRKGSAAGTSTYQGYTAISIDRQIYMAHRLAWLYMYGNWPSGQIDHINRDKADNRISNLRDVTPSENNLNRPMQKNNSSGITGVYPYKDRWYAVVSKNGKRRNIGYFDSKEEAARQRRLVIAGT